MPLLRVTHLGIPVGSILVLDERARDYKNRELYWSIGMDQAELLAGLSKKGYAVTDVTLRQDLCCQRLCAEVATCEVQRGGTVDRYCKGCLESLIASTEDEVTSLDNRLALLKHSLHQLNDWSALE